MKKYIKAKDVKKLYAGTSEFSLIDIREIGQHTTGHPFFSISIPYSIFEFKLLEILPNQNVRIVLIDNNNGISDLAAKQAEKLGYKNIFILQTQNKYFFILAREVFDIVRWHPFFKVYFAFFKIKSGLLKLVIKSSKFLKLI